MAKILVVVCSILLLCSLVHGIPPPCKTQSECDKGQCCLNGLCTSFGSANSGCSTVVYIRQPDVYTDYCPCDPRLYCQGNPDSKTSEGTCRYRPCKSTEDCQDDECCSNGVCRLKSDGSCVKYCTSSRDCGTNECCQSTIQPVGRRKRLSILPAGTCRPLGTSGSACSPNTGLTTGMYYQCPCQKGLTCHQAASFTVPIYGVCRSTAQQKCTKGEDCRLGECCHMAKGVCISAAAKREGTCEKACSSNKDCDPGHCCQADSMLKGRKRRAVSQDAAGSCKPYGSVGSECEINPISTGPTQHRCPCQSGLTCQDGVRVIPHVIGKCKAPVMPSK